MSYLVLSIGVIAGLGIIVAGWRGWRIDDHPLCRKCRYDLCGTPCVPERCPECGRALSGSRRVKTGNHKRLPIVAAFGAALFLSCGTLTTLRMQDIDWMRVKPLWWVKRQAQSSSTLSATTALDELWRRMNDAEVTNEERYDLIELALERQADRSTRWNARWGDIVKRAEEDGILTEAQWERFLRNHPVVILHVRPQARSGGIVPFSLEFAKRPWASSRFVSGIDVQYPVEYIEITPINPGQSPGPTERWDSLFDAMIPGYGIGVRTRAPPGRYMLRVQVRLQVWSYTGFKSASVGPTRDPPDLEWTEVLTAEFEVVPSDQYLVEPTRDNGIAQAVRECITVTKFTKRPQAGRLRPWITFDIQNPPCNLAFNSFVRVGDQEWPVGTFSLKEGESRSVDQNGMFMDGLSEDADRADIILRPNLELAEVRLAHGSSFLDQEIVIKDVPLEWWKAPGAD